MTSKPELDLPEEIRKGRKGKERKDERKELGQAEEERCPSVPRTVPRGQEMPKTGILRPVSPGTEEGNAGAVVSPQNGVTKTKTHKFTVDLWPVGPPDFLFPVRVK